MEQINRRAVVSQLMAASIALVNPGLVDGSSSPEVRPDGRHILWSLNVGTSVVDRSPHPSLFKEILSGIALTKFDGVELYRYSEFIPDEAAARQFKTELAEHKVRLSGISRGRTPFLAADMQPAIRQEARQFFKRLQYAGSERLILIPFPLRGQSLGESDSKSRCSLQRHRKDGTGGIRDQGRRSIPMSTQLWRTLVRSTCL